MRLTLTLKNCLECLCYQEVEGGRNSHVTYLDYEFEFSYIGTICISRVIESAEVPCPPCTPEKFLRVSKEHFTFF